VDETLFSVNSSTFLGDIYARFGLVNIADEAPDEFGSGFPQLSAEFVLEADPDIIFLGDAGFGVTAESVGTRPGWDSLSAVANSAVFELDTDIAGRWGPRTDELVRQIAKALESLN
jgi:iron complex transport system substrate-binding protein